MAARQSNRGRPKKVRATKEVDTIIDLDALDAMDAEKTDTEALFGVNLGGRKIIFKHPQRIKTRDIHLTSSPDTILMAVVEDLDDLEYIDDQDLDMGQLEHIFTGYNGHYGLDPGNGRGSTTS